MYYKAYLQTLCLFAWHHGKIKRNQPRPQNFFADFHKSVSSVGAISKWLKVPRSSVQSIVCKYKYHRTTQLSYRSGRRHVLSPRDERTLVRKVQINPRTTAKDRVKMLEETGTKVSISTVKEAYKPDSLTPALSGGMCQNSPNLLWEACGRLPKMFDPR